MDSRSADVHLVSTWLAPFCRTVVTCAAAAFVIVTRDETMTGKFTVLVALFHALLLVDTLMVHHEQVSAHIRTSAYMLLYWLVYINVCTLSPWKIQDTSWWVFGGSLGIIGIAYGMDIKRIPKSNATKRAVIVYVCGTLLIPNSMNTLSTGSTWEDGFRTFLFLFST